MKTFSKEDVLERQFRAEMQCQLVCGDGSGKKPDRHVDNCPVLAEIRQKLEAKKELGKK